MKYLVGPLALVVAMSFAVGTATGQSAKKVVDPNWPVPEKAAQRKNPLASKPESAEGGCKLFERMCVSCHGDESHGRTHDAPDLHTDAVQGESDGALFWRISNGNSRKGMPSFSGLPEGQRWQLVMYVRSLVSGSGMLHK
jgi:mono/diheme cytochrome c family protein